MPSHPDWISDGDVARAVHAHWGLAVDRIDHAPVGFGSHHWRVDAGGERWFATVDDLVAKRATQSEQLDEPFARLRATLATARLLRTAGFDFVVAPTPDLTGDVLVRTGERSAPALYPHVDGRTHGWGSFESSAARAAVVDLLVAVHGADADCRRAARTESFAMPNLDVLLTALAQLDDPWSGGPYSEPTRLLLADRVDAVTRRIERYRTLAEAQLARTHRFVLTHGEPHRGNTITTDTGVVLVDWDTALIAPPERDLWRLIDEEPEVGRWYENRTGARVDPDAVALYRVAWDLADVAIYTSQLRREHRDTDDTSAAFANVGDSLGRPAADPHLG